VCGLAALFLIMGAVLTDHLHVGSIETSKACWIGQHPATAVLCSVFLGHRLTTHSIISCLLLIWCLFFYPQCQVLCTLCRMSTCQVHYYLPNAIDLQDIFITKQRQQEAAKLAQAGSQQQQPQQQQQHDSRRYSQGSDSSSLPLASSLCTSAAGVRDMLLSNAAIAAANAAAAAEAAAADGSADVQWAKGGWAMEFDLAGCGAPETEDEALLTSRGVAGNFRAVHRAAKALGAVPEMLSSKDFAEHGPDERAVILYVAFLCSRLLECSKDDRAAHIIQTAWRQTKAKSAGELLCYPAPPAFESADFLLA